MSFYDGFAFVYDKFMENMPYDGWTEYIIKIWDKFGHRPELILDLACGTGNITSRLAEKGYDMIGIDISEQMLMIAQEKSLQHNHGILYLLQDMTEFELYGTVDSIVCICDSINYILEAEDLFKVFKLAKNYLNPGGYFIFDMNTEYKFKHIYAENTYSVSQDRAAYIWENYYYEDERINEYNATFFIEDEQIGLYKRFDEQHYEKAYSIEEIQLLIEKSGLNLIAVYDELDFNAPNEKSERVFFVVKKSL